MNKILFKTLIFLCLIMRISANESDNGIYTILGRPTENKITLKVICIDEYFVKVSYSKSGNESFQETPLFLTSRENPATIHLENMAKSTDYTYRLLYKKKSDNNWITGELCSFTTARNRGESFSLNRISLFSASGNPRLKLSGVTSFAF